VLLLQLLPYYLPNILTPIAHMYLAGCTLCICAVAALPEWTDLRTRVGAAAAGWSTDYTAYSDAFMQYGDYICGLLAAQEPPRQQQQQESAGGVVHGSGDNAAEVAELEELLGEQQMRTEVMERVFALHGLDLESLLTGLAC
jgi:hypothetical protein